MITYFKDKVVNQKRTKKNYKTLKTILKSVDSFAIIETTARSVTLSNTGVVLMVVPVSAGIAGKSSFCNELFYEIVKKKD